MMDKLVDAIVKILEGEPLPFLAMPDEWWEEMLHYCWGRNSAMYHMTEPRGYY